MLGIKPPINLAYHYARLDAVKKETSRIVISMSHTPKRKRSTSAKGIFFYTLLIGPDEAKRM